MVVINKSHPEVIERRYQRIHAQEESSWGLAVLVLLALLVLSMLFWWRDHRSPPAQISPPSSNRAAPASYDSLVPGNANSAAGAGGVHAAQ